MNAPHKSIGIGLAFDSLVPEKSNEHFAGNERIIELEEKIKQLTVSNIFIFYFYEF